MSPAYKTGAAYDAMLKRQWEAWADSATEESLKTGKGITIAQFAEYMAEVDKGIKGYSASLQRWDEKIVAARKREAA